MYEVEVKVAAEHDRVRERLPEDAEALGVVEQVDTYFDAPHRDFAETDEALRIRSERSLAADGTTGADEESATGADEEGATGADESATGTADGSRAEDDAERSTALTYKGPLVEAASKTREEFESGIEDGDAVAAALERLGFSPAATVRKERERFAVGEFTITLDVVDGLGEYVEVETEQSDDDVADAREDARALLRDLGCDPDDQIRTSYLGLLLADD